MIFSVVRGAWLSLRRDRAALALSFVVPIVFFSIFASIFAGRGGDATRKVRLLVVDEDGSERSRRFLAALATESALDLRRAPQAESAAETPPLYDRAAVEAAVRAGDAAVALIVPAGFGAAKLDFGPDVVRPQLELVADSSDPIASRLAAGLLQKVLFTGLGDFLLEGGIESLDRVAEFSPEQRERFAALLVEARTERPSGGAESGGGFALPVTIETRDLLGETKKNPLAAFYAAGLGVMFLLFTAAGAGGALIEERESGTLDRLLSTRITMNQLLLGKLAYLTSLGVVQLLVMFVWGWALFGVELPRHFVGFLAMAIPTALASSAFGLLLATVAKTRKQLVALSNLVVLSISAVGGSMFPRFLMPEAMQRASLVAFNSWALEGFLDVFWREEPLAGIVPEIAVLLGWSVVFFALARRLARRWEIV